MSNNRNKNSTSSMGGSVASKTDVRDDRSTNATGQSVDSGNRSHMQSMANVDKGSNSADASYAGKVKSKSPENMPGMNSQLAVQAQSHRPMPPHSAGATPGVHKPTPVVASSEQNTGTMEGSTIPLDDLHGESVEALFAALEKLQNAFPSVKIEIPKLLNAIKDKESLEEKVKELERSNEATKQAKEKDKNTFLTKYKDLKSLEESTKKKYTDSLKELAEAKKTNTELIDEVKRLMANETTLKLDNQHLRQELEESRRSSDKVSKELSDCKSRLSKLLSNKLTENNPQIADLSDTNRPTKLGEKHSELYDNQWTNAFEVLDKDFDNEAKTIQGLLNMYLGVYTFCKEKACEQIDQLKQVAYMWGSEVDQKPDSLELKTQVKEFRKYTAELSVKAIFQEYIQKHVAQDFLHIVTKPEISQYVEGCVKVCWLMNAQDPPVVIAAVPQTNSKFNAELYKPYTKGGDHVEYLVWPALLLHDGGSTLVRGVAQAYKVADTRHSTSRNEADVPTPEHEAQGHNFPDPQYTHSASSWRAEISCQQGENGNNTQYPMDASTGQAGISSHRGQNWNNTQYQMDASTEQEGTGNTLPYSHNAMSESAGQTDVSGNQGQNSTNTIYTNASGTGQVGAYSQQPFNRQYAQQANATSPTPSNIGLHSSSHDAPRSAAHSFPIQPNSSTTMHGGSGSTDLGKSSEWPTEDEWLTFNTLMQTEEELRRKMYFENGYCQL